MRPGGGEVKCGKLLMMNMSGSRIWLQLWCRMLAFVKTDEVQSVLVGRKVYSHFQVLVQRQ